MLGRLLIGDAPVVNPVDSQPGGLIFVAIRVVLALIVTNRNVIGPLEPVDGVRGALLTGFFGCEGLLLAEIKDPDS